jgi:glycerol-3-phosphate dehydrogenase
MAVAKLLQQSVVVIGAGTQGRRLAYMVSDACRHMRLLGTRVLTS